MGQRDFIRLVAGFALSLLHQRAGWLGTSVHGGSRGRAGAADDARGVGDPQRRAPGARSAVERRLPLLLVHRSRHGRAAVLSHSLRRLGEGAALASAKASTSASFRKTANIPRCCWPTSRAPGPLRQRPARDHFAAARVRALPLAGNALRQLPVAQGSARPSPPRSCCRRAIAWKTETRNPGPPYSLFTAPAMPPAS